MAWIDKPCEGKTFRFCPITFSLKLRQWESWLQESERRSHHPAWTVGTSLSPPGAVGGQAGRSQAPTGCCAVIPSEGKGRAAASVSSPGGMWWCVLTAKWFCSIPRCSDRRKCCFSKAPLYFSSRSFLPRMWGSSNWVKGTLEAGLSGLHPGSGREGTNDILSRVNLSKNLSLSEPQVDRLLPLVCASHLVVSDPLRPHEL